MAQKNIVIAPCGNRAFLFKEAWLKFPDEKTFDLCLLFYNETINDPGLYTSADHFFHLRDFKYHMIHHLLTELHPEWLEQYDHFYFPDDDIEIDTRQINALFAFSKAFETSISCAALTQDSYCSWPIFKQQPRQFCRFIGQIEVMAPLFSKAALQRCLPSFTANRSSWGLDAVWPKLLDYPVDKLVVFDAVTMKHIHPVGKGELYEKIGVDPAKEWADTIALYQAKRSNLVEYGRLSIVNATNNRLLHWYHHYREVLTKQKQTWRDKLHPPHPKR